VQLVQQVQRVLLGIRDRKAQLVLLDFRELPDLKARLDLRVLREFKETKACKGLQVLKEQSDQLVQQARPEIPGQWAQLVLLAQLVTLDQPELKAQQVQQVHSVVQSLLTTT
jgi:hypothetical protein